MKKTNYELSSIITDNRITYMPFGGRPVFIQIIPNFKNSLFNFGLKNDEYSLLKRINKNGFPQNISIPQEYEDRLGILIVFRVKKALPYGIYETARYIEACSYHLSSLFDLIDVSDRAYNYVSHLVRKNELVLNEGKVFIGGTTIECKTIYSCPPEDLCTIYSRNDEVGLFFDSARCDNLADYVKHTAQPDISIGDYVTLLFVKK